MRKLIFLLVMFPALVFAQGQQPNLKFGKPAEWEMTMTTYDEDPDADAVVLCSTREVRYGYIGEGFKVFYDISLRIKVLKDEGKKYATMEIPYYKKEDNVSKKEIIAGLKATAYNMVNGKVEKTKMSGSMVFDERLDKDYMVKKFTVPQVKVGTVFEVQYTKESDWYSHIDTWYAQKDIPVFYTNYTMTIPEYFRFDVDQTGQYRMETVHKRINMTLSIGGGVTQCDGEEYSFTGHSLPALKSDRFVWSKEDYCNKIFTELRGYAIPGSLYKNFTNSWEQVDQELRSDDDFGGRMRRSNPLKEELAASGALEASDATEKVALAFTAMKQRLRWNGEYRIWGRSSHSVLKDGTGSNADLNFILLNMLEDAGVQAFPVVMSSRDHGRLPNTHPSIKALNTFVVGFMANDTTVSFIDASAEDGYINVLPARLLVERARAIPRKGDAFWVSLQYLPAARRALSVTSKLDEEGTIHGELTVMQEGNYAQELRHSFRMAKDSTDFVNERASEFGVVQTSYDITGRKDFSGKVKEVMKFTKSCDATADKIYLNPMVIQYMEKPLFTDETRNCPVEFPYHTNIQMSVRTDIPNGYSVEEMPESVKMKSADGTIYFLLTFQHADNSIYTQMRFNLRKRLYGTEEYADLKSFFDNVAQKCNSMVVLKKNN